MTVHLNELQIIVWGYKSRKEVGKEYATAKMLRTADLNLKISKLLHWGGGGTLVNIV